MGVAWRMQRQLATAATSVLNEASHDWPRTTHLHADARGRTVYLRGLAQRASDVRTAHEGLASRVRLTGALGIGREMNPVLAVRDEVDLETRPSGWGVLSASSRGVRLHGVAGSRLERERVVTGLRTGSSGVGMIDDQISVDDEVCVESDRLDATLASLPALSEGILQQGLLAVARWGEKWRVLDLSQPAEKLRTQLLVIGVSEDAWIEGVVRDVQDLRAVRATWIANVQADAKRARLPPGHVVLALRADAVLLRGELGDVRARDLLADKVRIAARERTFIDNLAHSANRRPEVDIAPLATTLPRLPPGRLATLLAVGTPQSGWTLLDVAAIDVQDDSTLGADALPEGLDRRLVLPDVLSIVAWLHSIQTAPAPRNPNLRVPHLLIAIIGDRVILRGVVAAESERTQIETAARQRYETRALDIAIRLDAAFAPADSILPTVGSLPAAPALNTTGLLSIAIPGDAWHTRTLRVDLLDSAGLERSGIVPEDVSLLQLMPDVLAIADVAKAHLATIQSAPPGIPLQTP